jgi:alpha-tubulin suppressor-like RCC1 family protein
MRSGGLWVLAGTVLLVLGCGPDGNASPDQGSQGTVCVSDGQCSDGTFCNGVERCQPDSGDADAEGCVPAAANACLAQQTCSERDGRCVTDCDQSPDADGDGFSAINCGGDDCADEDPNAFPGNLEVCDALGHDEDCDPATLGGTLDSDLDGDEEVANTCCNVQQGQSILCGLDCDDALASVNTSAAEVCNGRNDDCDGTVDEGVFATLYRDLDGDGFGNPATATMQACGDPLYVQDNGDCSDTNSAVNPAAVEICDGVDNDCDGDGNDEIDADGDRHLLPASLCEGGPLLKDDCDDNNATVHPASVDRCNDVDDDCDAQIDERSSADGACALASSVEVAICAYAGAAVQANRCTITRCDPGFADCDGQPSNGCEAELGTASHCAACNDDCGGGACSDGVCGGSAFEPTHFTGGYAWGGIGVSDGFRSVSWRSGSGSGRLPQFDRDDADEPLEGVLDFLRPDQGSGCWLSTSGALQCRGASQGNFATGQDATLRTTTSWEDTLVVDARVVRMTQRHGCAIANTGGVSCWGAAPANGQLAYSGVPMPVSIPGGGVVDIATADRTSCALTSGGEVWCWGRYSGNGQALGAASRVPTRVTSEDGTPLDADAIFSGPDRLCALSGTTAFCWGSLSAALGANRTASNANFAEPVWVSPPAMTQVAMSERATCGLESSGLVRCWGTDTVGNGTPNGVAVPAPGAHVVDWLANGGAPLSASAIGGSRSGLCALRSGDGSIRCWGSLGGLWDSVAAHPDPSADIQHAIPIPPASSLMSISVASNASCAVLRDGRTRCWGALAHFFEDAGEYQTSPAVDVTWPGNVRDVSVGEDVICAVVADGQVWCVGGLDDNGPELGSLTGSAVPVRVLMPPASQVHVANSVACAVLVDGGVRCWGRDTFGMLGDGAATLPECGGECTTAPRAVVGLPAGDPVVELSLAEWPIVGGWVCARLASGRVTCWGAPYFSGLGDGSVTPADSAGRFAAGLNDAVSLSIGIGGGCAVRAGGTVACWGLLPGSDVSDTCGASACARRPQPVTGLSNAVDVHAGFTHVCVRTVDSTLRCWGDNSAGNLLEDPSTVQARNYPGPEIPVVAGIAAVGRGSASQTMCGIVGSGVLCWGPATDSRTGAAYQSLPALPAPNWVTGL